MKNNSYSSDSSDDTDTESLIQKIKSLSEEGQRAVAGYVRVAVRPLPRQPGYVLEENYRKIRPVQDPESDDLQPIVLEQQTIEVTYVGECNSPDAFKLIRKQVDSVTKDTVKIPPNESDSEDEARTKKKKCNVKDVPSKKKYCRCGRVSP